MPLQRTFPEYQIPAAWRPRVDICRGPSGWLCKIDLAGVRPEDVRVDLLERQLRVIGSRRDARLEQGWEHYALEIAYSRFERVVEFPDSLEGAQVQSEYRQGMLYVWIKTRRDMQKER